jgi:UDP-N-acetylglucosamine diphosphorylase/glucosamine-1-phosphate N-acetyltransferase
MLILCEDEQAFRFEPLALTRSTASLRFGAFTVRERFEKLFPERSLALLCRGFLAETETAANRWSGGAAPAGDALFVAAGLTYPSRNLLAAIRSLDMGAALVNEGRFVAARAMSRAAAELARVVHEILGEEPLPGSPLAPDWPRLLEKAGFIVQDTDASFARTLADLIAGSASAIDADFALLEVDLPPPDPAMLPGVHFLAPGRVRLAEEVRIDPGVVLDAREGAILLGAGTRVMANSYLAGPLAIGPGCLIKPLSRIVDGTSLGPICKVSGEVDATVIQGHSNKQHDGFLGHSYLGSWVNLGAATDTSDLKNNYGPVKVVLGGESFDTGSRHVGSFIGDHTKTGINTMLNTGTVIGVAANVFGSDYPPKEIPSFTWGGGEDWQEHELGKALTVAEIVTSRRGVPFREADRRLLERVHAATAQRRHDWLAQRQRDS